MSNDRKDELRWRWRILVLDLLLLLAEDKVIPWKVRGPCVERALNLKKELGL